MELISKSTKLNMFTIPVGSPPRPVRARFVQKMEWFRWPPPLNFNAGARLIIFETSPKKTIQNLKIYITTLST